MPKKPLHHDRKFQMRIDEAFTAMLDTIRRRESDLPTGAEMIRRLVDRAYFGTGPDACAPPESRDEELTKEARELRLRAAGPIATSREISRRAAEEAVQIVVAESILMGWDIARARYNRDGLPEEVWPLLDRLTDFARQKPEAVIGERIRTLTGLDRSLLGREPREIADPAAPSPRSKKSAA